VYEEKTIVALALTEEVGLSQAMHKLHRSFERITLKKNASFPFEDTRNAIRSFLKACCSQSFLARGTPFQIRVWQTLTEIRFAEHCSYSVLAAKAGFPRAVRAVASAVAANPLAVVVPCHRIIHKNGTLGAFGWGPKTKEKLLVLEQRVKQTNWKRSGNCN
jgi:O-6-methylguanine DNA methyltransferase